MSITENKTPSGLYSQAYRICASIRALQGSNGLCVESGAQERLESALIQHAVALKVEVRTLWQRYDQCVFDSENHRVIERIKARQIRMDEFSDPRSRTQLSHIKVVLEDGQIASIHFDINHGLPNGSYSLVRNPE